MAQDSPAGTGIPRSVLADDGKTYVDDPQIGNTASLLRRVPWWHIVWDNNTKKWRASSAAFENSDDGSPMSVRVRPLLEEMGLDLASVLADYPDFGLAEFPAGEARAKQQVVALQEVHDEPAHGAVAGKKTGGVKKHLGKKSEWCLPLSEAALAKAEQKRGPV